MYLQSYTEVTLLLSVSISVAMHYLHGCFQVTVEYLHGYSKITVGYFKGVALYTSRHQCSNCIIGYRIVDHSNFPVYLFYIPPYLGILYNDHTCITVHDLHAPTHTHLLVKHVDLSIAMRTGSPVAAVFSSLPVCIHSNVPVLHPLHTHTHPLHTQ